MKNSRLKLAVALSALIIGIVIVWTSGVIRVLNLEPENLPSPVNENERLTTKKPLAEEIGQVVVQFKGFELYKDWAAQFEITNYTAKPITYIGFKNTGGFDFCTLYARREINETRGVKTSASGATIKDHCRESKAVFLQTIEPNESVAFSVFKYELQELVNLREEHKNAKIGFEFFVNDEKRREIFWSQDITFPEDRY